MRIMDESFFSRHPSVGIVASVSGFVTSIASALQFAGVVIGLIGAVFGCAAGYYTYRIQKRKFDWGHRKDRRHP
jgi:uncharacterized membrane protein